jgi:hypothetical protein
MMKPRENDSSGDAVLFLATLSQSELETWLRIYLAFGYSGQAHLEGKYGRPADVLLDRVWDSTHQPSCPLGPADCERLRLQMKTAVATLLRQWTPPTETVDYMLELVTLTGAMNVLEGIDVLWAFALEGTAKGIGVGFDLHREILRVLFGLDYPDKYKDPRLHVILSREIDESPVHGPLLSHVLDARPPRWHQGSSSLHHEQR